MTSLIQQRMAIDRQRTAGTIALVGGALFLAAVVLVTVTEGVSTSRLFEYAICALWVVFGIVSRRRARTALVAFETREGVGAGVQLPVGTRRDRDE